ncbi:MAG TPA: methyl-accepting chemotaxis protein [Thermodesulfovibrionales bacterium]|nr:methyl-accepting chemotaxis protein [Thermodesulfovibrionales bacterium]
MNTFKNLTIGRRLSVSFGLLFVVVLILGISWQRGIVSLKEVEGKKNDLIELKEKLREMQVNHYRWVDSLREAVRAKGKFEGAINPAECPFGKWYYSYHMPYPELKPLFDALDAPHKKFHESGAMVVKALQQGNYAEADRLSLHTRRVALPELMSVYEPFMQNIGDLYSQYKVQSEQSVRKQGIISKVIMLLALVSVTILGVILTRSIVKPLHRVTETALKIADGEIPDIWQKEAGIESQNEILQLEDAFIRMASSLNELSKTAEKIAAGDLETKVAIRSSKDVLATSIAKMVDNLKQSVDELHSNTMNLALGMSDYFAVISELSIGNLDVHASEDTGDDLLNQLGKVTNNMISEYKKLAACIEEVQQGNMEVKLHIRSEKDVLGIGFEHMLEHLRKTSDELHSYSMNLAMGLTDYFFLLQQVSVGDLTVRANEDTGDDLLNQLGKATNTMISSLKDLTFRVREQADFLANSANSLAQVTKQSTRALSELASAVSMMSAAASNVADSSQDVSGAAKVANVATRKGEDLMLVLAEKTKILQDTTERSVSVMQGLSSRSQEIGNIVKVMTKIAFQTNLLALNAAIEAARAGESGHGFAVVADEVRKLAENSANSAREISKIIKEVQTETEEAVVSAQDGRKETEAAASLISEVTGKFTGIASQVDNIVKEIGTIASSAADTATSAAEASASSEEQTAAVEELAASAAQLSSTAQILRETMSRFKV